jgi:hypothetical protein
MVTQKEFQAHQHDQGRTARIKQSAIVWLVFYAVAATIGLITKVGEAGMQLAVSSPF